MSKVHTIAEGDCCSSLAAANGFGDYKGIYDDGANAALKASRPNPNMMVVGESITIPDRGKKDAPAKTNATAKFKLKAHGVKLHIRLRDNADGALQARAWRLTVGPDKFEGHGATIKQAINPVATAATLEIDLDPKAAPPAPAPAPAPAGGPPPYPPAIAAIDYKDKEEAAYLGADERTVRWTLVVGGLPSFNVVAGVQQRLENLGFDPFGEPGKEDDSKTKAAVIAYQRKYKLPETGKALDIQDDIRDRHDKTD
jgi:hypothetical protein